jgi:nitrogen-specific signal transduction histidine kinase
MVIIDNILGPVVLVNANYRVTEVNDRGEVVLGGEQRQIRGETLGSLTEVGILDSQALER